MAASKESRNQELGTKILQQRSKRLTAKIIEHSYKKTLTRYCLGPQDFLFKINFFAFF
jgi:hypothetical protein